MKTMTCRQLGGACDERFQADSFEEMAEISRNHGMEMFQKGDKEHLLAMENMNKLMGDPQAMKQWMDNKKSEFERLPEDNS